MSAMWDPWDYHLDDASAEASVFEGTSASGIHTLAITNLLSADVPGLGHVKLSANWMAAAGHPGEDAGLFDAVRAVGLELCPALGVAVPVGKDSLSMRTVWEQQGAQHSVTAPKAGTIKRIAFAPGDRVEEGVELLEFE